MISSILHLVGLRPIEFTTPQQILGGGEQGPLAPSICQCLYKTSTSGIMYFDYVYLCPKRTFDCHIVLHIENTKDGTIPYNHDGRYDTLF